VDWTPVAATAVGVLGAFGGSAFTLWMTGRQERARQHQARAEAVVAERRAVYIRFIAEVAPWLAYVDQIATDPDEATPAPPPGDLTDHRRRSLAEIELLGSRGVRVTAGTLWLAVITAVEHIEENQDDPVQLGQAQALMDHTYRTCLNKMREEVGLDPPAT
jgi:hypothetical protein